MGIKELAKEYRRKLIEGPITQEDEAGHAHVLNAIKNFNDAYDSLVRIIPHPNELDALTRETRKVLGIYEVPFSMVVTPTPRPPKRRPGRRASLHSELARLATDVPSLRPHLVPLLRQAKEIALTGTTHENKAGNIRFQVFLASIRVWDLTNAGKRGKKVDYFSLYNLDMSFGSWDDPQSKEAQKLKDDVFDWPNKLKTISNYQKALSEAKKFTERGVLNPRISQGQEMGVRINPAGFKPFRKSTPKFEIEADPKKGYSVSSLTDKVNEPACISRGKVRDIARFYAWVNDSWDKIKGLSFHEMMEAMSKEGFDYHYYCQMD